MTSLSTSFLQRCVPVMGRVSAGRSCRCPRVPRLALYTTRCMATFDGLGTSAPRRDRDRDSDGGRDRGRGRDRDRGGRHWERSGGPGGSERRGGRYTSRDDRRGGRYQNPRNDRQDRDNWSDGDDQADKKSGKLEFQGDSVYGSSPVLAALDANRRVMHALYVQEGIGDSKKKELPAIRQALARAQKMNIPLIETSKHDLNMVTSNRPHQGIVLDASPLNCDKMDVFPPADAVSSSRWPVWLCLDEITDPQNLGAVIRTAFFLGADGVLLCSKNSAPLSGVVSKASSGALEKMTIHSCRSLPTTLVDAKAKGWDVVAASGDDDSTPCQEFEITAPTVLVMGSEGYGLRKTVRNACTRAIRVDRGAGMGMGMGMGMSAVGSDAGELMTVDSLNVSVATGILLHTLLCTRASSS